MSGLRERFIGRDHEMSDLLSALDAILSGAGRIVMLAGEPGIGKTRTAEELSKTAQQRGAQVWWGRCPEERGAPPYWPWLQAMRSYADRANTDKLREELGAGASDIAEILPDIARKLADLEPPLPLEPEQARFRLFDSITTLLKNVCKSQPLVIVLDDLHRADRSSLMLLEFVAREIQSSRILIVGSYRDVELSRGHPLTQTLGTLTGENLFQRITLRGLTEQDVEDYVVTDSDELVNSGSVNFIYRHTEGNPLFIRELVRLIGREGGFFDAEFRIPEGIREVIGSRLHGLSEECNWMLSMASVVGREFDFVLLGQLTELPDDNLLGLIDEALESHVIEDMAGSLEHYQFTHALIQETLYQELSSSRRVRLHARIGEALEKLYEEDIESRASELVHHYAQAERLSGNKKLVEYSLMAGKQALGAYAWQDALVHFEKGLAAKEQQSMDDEKADLLFGLAQAQRSGYERNNTVKALETVMPAFNYYVESGDISSALAIAEYPFGISYGYTYNGELAGKAAELADEGSIQQGYFLSKYGLSLYHQQGDSGQAMKLFDKAMRIARNEHDASLEIRILNDMGMIYEGEENYSESLAVGLRVINLSNQHGLPIHESSAHTRCANAYIALGNLTSAHDHALALLDYTEQHPSNSSYAYFFFMNDMVARLNGEWLKAKSLSDQGLSKSPSDARLLYSRTLLEYQLGHFSEGETYMERLLDVMRSTPPIPSLEYGLVPPVIAITSLITGDTSRFDMLEPVIDVLLVPRAISHAYWQSQLALGIATFQRGNTDQALKQYELLKLYPYPVHGWGMISNNRLLGLLSSTFGDLETSTSHFEDAIAVCRKGGFRPELAWVSHDYADMLFKAQRSSFPTDGLNKVSHLIEEGLSIATELGMNPLVEKLTALKERLNSATTRSSYPKGLTEREVEVLQLAAQGKTNREIANELFISVRTVQNHIRNIYNKIGVRNRAEATAFAINNLGSHQ